MIQLTRLNGNPLVINSDLIKYVESSPDTVLTLVNGEKIVVLEACDDVVHRTIAYRARVFAQTAGSLQSLASVPAPEGARPSASEPRRAEDSGDARE